MSKTDTLQYGRYHTWMLTAAQTATWSPDNPTYQGVTHKQQSFFGQPVRAAHDLGPKGLNHDSDG